MSDNIGPYIDYDELITELQFAGSGVVSSADTTLSAKVVDAGGDKYTFSGGSPIVGDVISQAGFSAIVIALPIPTQIQINKTDVENNIAIGPAKVLHSETVPRAKGEIIIQNAMDMIDEQTGQFFNKRSGVFDLEGNNTQLMHFPVPIIEITKLLINSSDQELFEGDTKDFVAFKGRLRPTDDRRNPRIKLNFGRGRDSIFISSLTNRIFTKGTFTNITGSFGFLELNGNTPALIKKTTVILASLEINEPPSASSSSVTSAGPLKRTKVDIHEEEFFESSQSKSKTETRSGSAEADKILAMFRTPIRVAGSFSIL